jgi:hypothetical protein
VRAGLLCEGFITAEELARFVFGRLSYSSFSGQNILMYVNSRCQSLERLTAVRSASLCMIFLYL